MARTTRPIILTFDLLPETYATREDTEIGASPRAPTIDDLSWQTFRESREVDALGGWAGATDADVWPARVTLPLDGDGDVITDAVFDVTTNGHRVVDSPTLRAAGVRRWHAIELEHAAPEGSTVSYRLNDGTDDHWYNATAPGWEVATDPALHWSTQAEVQQNVATYPGLRELTVRARLSSTDVTARPAFYGVTIAYGVREFGDEDDALIRTLVQALRAELRSVGVAQTTTADGSGASFQLAGEMDYQITDVLAVFNLTADPNELVELPGTFTASTQGTPGTPATWVPDASIADGQVVRVEFEFAPQVIAARHRDLVQIDRTPAVLIMPGGGTPERMLGQGRQGVVRDLTTAIPTALGLEAPTYITTPINVAVISELGADVRRIASDLRDFLRGAGYRSFVSPETGRITDVQETTPMRTSAGTLAQGVNEARGVWTLGYHATGAGELKPVLLTRPGGVLPTISEA